MKILFIYSVDSTLSFIKPLGSPSYIQFGISHLSSFLKQFNHNIKLLVLSRSFGNKNYDTIRKKIGNFKPKIIGFYSVSTQYEFISDVSKFIKSNYPEIFLIIGGPHATLNPEEVAKDSFDAICIGEGERPMIELANMLEKNEFPSNIKNLWIKKDNIIEKNQMAPFYEKLDLLPFPDRTIWEEYIDYNPGFLEQNISILLGRGCPFSCTYCCNHAFRKITDGNYVRYRSPRNIIEEIKLIHEKYPLENSIFLEVESFNVNKKWAIEVCNEIEKYNESLDIPLSFRLNIRITPNANLDILFEACKKANILDLSMGLESGSERVRKDILKRNYLNNDFIKTINLAKKYGLSYSFYVMIGIPGETFEDFKETIKICRICQPKAVILDIFYPYPGTDLYELCKKMNLLQGKINVNMERRKPIINLPGFSKKQIQRSYIWFNYNVYKGYKPRIKLILKLIIRFLGSNSFVILILPRFLNSRLMIKLKKYFISFYFK
jgi:anaerobic magnesium-protoporphyrin IX monomethyl ester cyclase